MITERECPLLFAAAVAVNQRRHTCSRAAACTRAGTTSTSPQARRVEGALAHMFGLDKYVDVVIAMNKHLATGRRLAECGGRAYTPFCTTWGHGHRWCAGALVTHQRRLDLA